MSLIVRNPGMLATVQDLGRVGAGSLGVSRSGAADTLSLRVGNRLLANPDNAGALELTLVGGSFEITRAVPVVLAGAKCDAHIQRHDGTRTPIYMWTPANALPGDVLHIGAIGGPGEGCRAYLCVMGGVDTPCVMGSRATQVGSMMSGGEWSGGVGGLPDASRRAAGAPLRAGDELAIAPRAHDARTRLISAGLRARCQEAIARRVIRVTKGPQWELLNLSAQATLATQRRVLDLFDRRGVRLSPGTELAPSANAHPTQPTDVGFIQAPGAGELIILGPDGPPTGGYPVVACVASVDLPVLGQLRPRDSVRFEMIDVARARELLRDLWRDIDQELPPLPVDAPLGAPAIDINADVGEDPGALARDESIAACVTTINIACGGHAGDESTMRHMLGVALRLGLCVAAHPSYPDRANFGRVAMTMSPDDLAASVAEQVGVLARIAKDEGVTITRIKAHGALYHAANVDPRVCDAIARGVDRVLPIVAFIAQAGLGAAAHWRAQGRMVIDEAFADRCYRADGSLVPRSEPGALIESPSEAAEQASRLAAGVAIVASNGQSLLIRAGTICIHSDTPHAIDNARAVARSIGHIRT